MLIDPPLVSMAAPHHSVSARLPWLGVAFAGIVLVACDDGGSSSSGGTVAAPALADVALSANTTLVQGKRLAAPIVLANTGGAVAANGCTDMSPEGSRLSDIGLTLERLSSSGQVATCQITGTPTATVSSQSYTIRARNAGGADATTTVTITVAAGAVAIEQIAAANNHTCVLSSTGRLYCWGRHNRGQIGHGDTGMTTGDSPEAAPVLAPRQVGSAADWAALSAGFNHSCAVNAAGELHCWGDNREGQLGVGANGNSLNVPTRVGTATNWAAVAASNDHTCAVNTGGELYCWGSNGDGRLGVGSTPASADTPQRVGSGSDWEGVFAGEDHTCATTTDGASLYCWGLGNDGELGQGNKDNQSAPTQLMGISDVASFGAGNEHNCLVLDNGQLHCWGENNDFEVGLAGNTDDAVSPQRVGTASDWASATGGGNHSCAINTGDQLHCWGDNEHGQLGIAGNAMQQETPMRVGTSANWTIVDGGNDHACAANSDGKLFCWGRNHRGQLGQGDQGGDAGHRQPELVNFDFR